MKIEHADVHGDTRLDPRPGVWGNLNNTGCGIPGCNCSPGYWLTIRDGDRITRVSLTRAEAKAIEDGDFDLRGGEVTA